MIDIPKIKDNLEIRSETYVDAESFRDNFEGSEEQLQVIANTIYECVDGSNEDPETFGDEVQSMIEYDYDYLTLDQQDKVFWMVDDITTAEFAKKCRGE